MSDTNLGPQQTLNGAPGQPSEATAPHRGLPEQTAWVGWGVFAAVMMLLIGTFHIIDGLVAIFRDEYYVVGKEGLVLHVDYTAWGWTYLIGGVIIVAAGFSLFSGKMWARIVAVGLALLSCVLNLGFFEAYPWWSALMITLDVLVIWALLRYRNEVSTRA